VTSSSFVGLVQINTAGAHDEIRIGVDDNPNTRAHFEGGLRIDGGLGDDSLDYLTGHSTFAPGTSPVIANVETIT